MNSEKQKQKSIPNNTFSPLPPSPGLISLLHSQLFYPPRAAQEVWRDYSQYTIVSLCQFILTLFLCFRLVPLHRLQSIRKKSLPVWTLPQTTVPSEKSAPACFFHSLLFLQEISNCSSVGSSMGCSMNICSAEYLLQRGFFHRLEGNLCIGSWSTSSPSFFFSDLGVCNTVSHFFPPLLCLSAIFFLS